MDNFNQSWYKTWWGMLLIVVATIFLVMFSVFIFYVLDLAKKIQSGQFTASQKTQILSQAQIQKIEGVGNYWYGTSTPKTTLVIFADFACPICKTYNNTFRQISYFYKNSIKIIYRDFPLHEESIDLSMAARCAGEQGLFWPMHDILFQFQGVKTKDELSTLAKQVGADMVKFNTCFDNKKYLTQITKDNVDAEDLGVQGTPTWFIEGQMISGDIPYDDLKSVIEEIINN